MDTRETHQEQSPTTTHQNGRGPAPTIEEEERSGPRKRYIFGTIGAIAAIVVLIFGVKYYLYASVHEGTDDARIDADAVAVTSKINERIDQMLVNTNDAVHKGEPLIQLDRRVELEQVRQARANLDLALANQRTTVQQGRGGMTQAQANTIDAQAQVTVAQAGVAQANAQLLSARAQLPAAQASYDRTLADYRRAAALVATGDISRQTYDAARASLAAAGAQLHSAQDDVNVAVANLDAAEQRVGAAQALVSAAQGGVTTAQGKLAQAADPSQVAAARAALAIAEQNLAYTQIHSPIDGYVGEKSAEVGQTVQAGMTLLTLIPSGAGKIYVTANYKETQMTDMKVGQPADIHVDAYPGHTFHGHVESINPASQNTYALVPAQNATGNFVKVTQRIPVRISIDDMSASMPLRPGMSVEAYVKVR